MKHDNCNLSVRWFLLIAMASLLPGCIHWPDAPYLDKANSLSRELSDQLNEKHPNPTLLTPVYRTHMEERSGYRVNGQMFVFKSESKTFRAAVDSAGVLTIHQAEMKNTLPVELENAFFKGPYAMVPGGAVAGPVWRHSVAGDWTDSIYEFEYTPGTDGTGRGLGQIGASSPLKTARYIRESGK